MNHHFWLMAILSVSILFPSLSYCADSQVPDENAWTSDFHVEKESFASTGRNPFFILEPGYQLTLDGDGKHLVITVLNETKMVDGVETRVVEERETEDGELVEVSRNYFAISKQTNSVYYFGEDVDEYKNGQVSGHPGSWLSGVKGAKFGVIMPGERLIGGRYYQEVAPQVAMDRAEIVSLRETVKTPSGEFKNCLKTKETTPLEPEVVEYKYYAPEIGLVQEESLKLTKYGKEDGAKNR
jgi:hypothetical protein